MVHVIYIYLHMFPVVDVHSMSVWQKFDFHHKQEIEVKTNISQTSDLYTGSAYIHNKNIQEMLCNEY